jgi:hypothetical protein
LKIKLKLKLKISEELECAFGIVGKILMSKDLMEFIWYDLDSECGEILIFK